MIDDTFEEPAVLSGAGSEIELIKTSEVGFIVMSDYESTFSPSK